MSSERWRNALKRIGQALSRPDEELGRWQRAAKFAARLGRHGARQLVRDRAPQMAAALAYRTLFSIVPLLVVTLVVFRQVLGPQAFREPLTRLLDTAGLSDLALSGEVDPSGAEPGEAATVGEWIERLVVRIGDLNFGAIGAVCAVILIYAAISLLMQIEQSFNLIVAAPTRRRLVARLTSYWTLLTLGPVAIAVSIWISERFRAIVSDMGGSGVLSLLGVGATFALSWLLLLLAYSVVPNSRVRLRPALIGAFVAAALWEVGKFGFGQYVQMATGFARFYGSLGLLPLFLLWVYLTWLIILFGLEVAYALQTVGSSAEVFEARERRRARVGALTDPSAPLMVMAAVAERFTAGKRCSADEAADRSGLPEPVAERLLESLVERGLLHRVEASLHEGESYTLARPPEAITAQELLRAGAELSGADVTESAWPILRRLREAQANAAEGLTLASFTAESRYQWA